MKLHYDVDFGDFSVAGENSSAVKKKLTQLGLSPVLIRRVAIAMYEGEINMVIHAFGGSIDVLITTEKISVVLNDKGPGISDVELAMREGYTTAGEEVRQLGFGAGMGLPNMKKYSDEMYIETEVGVGTRVELVFHIGG